MSSLIFQAIIVLLPLMSSIILMIYAFQWSGRNAASSDITNSKFAMIASCLLFGVSTISLILLLENQGKIPAVVQEREPVNVSQSPPPREFGSNTTIKTDNEITEAVKNKHQTELESFENTIIKK